MSERPKQFSDEWAREVGAGIGRALAEFHERALKGAAELGRQMARTMQAARKGVEW